MSAVARMIERAEKETPYALREYDSLVVLDGLSTNPASGVRCIVWFAGETFYSETQDGQGRGFIATANQRETAVQRSLDGYLDIVHNGIK